VIAKALVGDYRPEHLFTLRQSLQGFCWYQKMIGEVDCELKKLLDELPRSEGAADQLPPRTKTCIYQRASNEPRSIFPLNCIALVESISPTYPVSAPILHKPSCRKSAPMSLDFGMPPLSHPGWGSLRRSRLAAVRLCGLKPEE
jgi:hypothetical protein